MVSITLEELWMVSDRIVNFWFFVKFHRSGPAKIFSFWTITEQVSYQSKKVPNQAKIDLDFKKMVSITLEGFWMVSDRIVDFWFFVKFHRSGPAKIFSFRTITEQVSYQSKKVPNQAKIDLNFIKIVSITLEGFWMVSDRIVDFWFFVKFHRSGPAKIFSFWTITEEVSYQSKKVPNQAKIDLDFKKMVSITLEGFWMVSDRIVDFWFFVKFHRSGPAKIFSFRTITEQVSYQSKKVPNQAKIDLNFIKIVSITLEGFWMVSDRIVDFWFFVKFHRSGPAKIFSFWTITEEVSYQSKKVPNQAKIDLDFQNMVRITVEGLWMVEDRIDDFRFVVTFHRSGSAKIFRFWTITVHVSYPSKKVYNQAEIYQDFIKRVSITLEGLWMVSDRIVDFQFFVKFHRSGPAKIFSFWTITEHVSSQSKKVPNPSKIDQDFMKMVSITLEGFWMVSDRIVDFWFFIKFHRSGPAKIFSFRTITEEVSYQSKKVPNQAKIDLDFIKIVSITLEGLWMVSDRIVDFQFFVKFHRSRPAKIFNFQTITEQVIVINRKRFLIKPRLIWTSRRWWVLLWKDFGWFLIELLIFNFLSNFTGPDLQKFSVFELSRRRLVINHKRFLIKPRLIWTSRRWWVLLWKDYGWLKIELMIFDFLSHFTGPDLQKFSIFELLRCMLVIHQKKFIIKPRFIRTSSREWVLLWKDYGWFLIELSIFNFLSNFTGPDLQKFSVFELSRSMLVLNQKRFLIHPRLIRTSWRWWVLLWKDFGWFQIELSIFDFLSNFTGPDLQKFSVF